MPPLPEEYKRLHDQFIALAALRVKRLIVPLPPKPAADVLPLLDQYAKLVA
jgi:hypothetical protein